MFGIGLPEMILILALALIVVGPDKLPDLARSLAKGILELKKTAEGLKAGFTEEDNPLAALRPELEDAARSLQGNLLDAPDPDRQTDTSSAGVNPDRQSSGAEARQDIDAEFTAVSDPAETTTGQTAEPETPVSPPTDRQEPGASEKDIQLRHE